MKDLWETFFTVVGGIIGTIVILVIICLLLGWLLAIMWNYTMPDLFGLPETDWSHMFVLSMMIRLLWGTDASKVIKKED